VLGRGEELEGKGCEWEMPTSGLAGRGCEVSVVRRWAVTWLESGRWIRLASLDPSHQQKQLKTLWLLQTKDCPETKR